MNPGDLVKNRWDGYYLPMYKKIHGIHSTHYLSTEIGMILDFGYGNDIPYVHILTSEGKTGWVRYEQVEVIR